MVSAEITGASAFGSYGSGGSEKGCDLTSIFMARLRGACAGNAPGNRTVPREARARRIATGAQLRKIAARCQAAFKGNSAQKAKARERTAHGLRSRAVSDAQGRI